jgi:acyl-coenzyme A thioesterase 13
MGAPTEALPAWIAAAARRWLEDAGATVEEGQDRAFITLRPLTVVRVPHRAGPGGLLALRARAPHRASLSPFLPFLVLPALCTT